MSLLPVLDAENGVSQILHHFARLDAFAVVLDATISRHARCSQAGGPAWPCSSSAPDVLTDLVDLLARELRDGSTLVMQLDPVAGQAIRASEAARGTAPAPVTAAPVASAPIAVPTKAKGRPLRVVRRR